MPKIHLLLADAGAAALATAAYFGFQEGGRPFWVVALVVAAIGPPLAVRRLWPLPVLAVVALGSFAAVVLDLTREPLLPVSFVLYVVGLSVPAARAIPALVTTLIGAAAVLLTASPDSLFDAPVEASLLLWLIMSAAWGAGRAVRVMRAREARRQAFRAEEALTGERLRIARELHDVVAHSMSLIAVKASVANHVAEQNPGEARDALRIIEETSRGTLTELRRLLGVLRTPDGAGLAPSPGIDDLGKLAEHAREAGIEVTLRVDDRLELPESLSLSVHRIVQESLTNVVKHAAAKHCEVVVSADERDLRIEVTDDGRGPGAGSGGHGLLGMRERVMMYGGAFEAGAAPTGGFRVSARLPREPDEVKR
ncbi:sensor histidine kinase [Amycolatopsis magusensis]|uniref:histidine kinase n=1 Tax=Amycolatopsis magusensis TaxID=882444 RepID=A0ABS4Q6V1_9PSEU|nr:histidine kinase [Amycolatopsis magusensis]MBP2186818.1 signal transduction histidine kinase [Amycolatopsis magusensis]